MNADPTTTTPSLLLAKHAGIGAPRLARRVAVGVGVGLALPAIAVWLASFKFGWVISRDPLDWFEAMQGLGAVWAAALTLVYLAITLPLITTALAQAQAAQISAEAAALQADASKAQADANNRMVQIMLQERQDEKQRLWMPLKVAIDDRIDHIRLLRDFVDQSVRTFASSEKNTSFIWFTPEFEAQVQIAMGLIPQYSQALRSASAELREMDQLAQAIAHWKAESYTNESEHFGKGDGLYKALQNAAVRARHHLLAVKRRLDTETIPHDQVAFPESAV